MPSADLPRFTARPVAECTAAEVVAALTRGFEGYLVPLRFTPEAYERRFRAEHLDPYASRVYSSQGADVGVVLIARRGWTRRVAAMGFAPEVRGQGLGRRSLEEAIGEARDQGDRAMLLEVIETNAPALALYTRLGFGVRRRLVGWRREPGEIQALRTRDRLVEIDPLEFARAAAREGDLDLPWMLSPETLSAALAPARAYRLGQRAWALIGDPAAEKLALTALVVSRAHRRKGWGTRMLQALAAAFPGRTWWITPVVPEELAPGFFTKTGWKRQELTQLEMRLELDGGTG